MCKNPSLRRTSCAGSRNEENEEKPGTQEPTKSEKGEAVAGRGHNKFRTVTMLTMLRAEPRVSVLAPGMAAARTVGALESDSVGRYPLFLGEEVCLKDLLAGILVFLPCPSDLKL